MYRFLMEAIFTYILAVYMFRAGVRRNNTDVIMASSVKFSTIYFGISKTNYQKIEIIDITTRVGAPPDVQTYFQQHESFFRKKKLLKHLQCTCFLSNARDIALK